MKVDKFMDNFEPAIEFVRKNEGGYVNHPEDDGGETNFGITKARYPDLDIKNLTWPVAKEIYRKDFWYKFNLDKIDSLPVATTVLDFRVNSGAANSVIQRALKDNFDSSVVVDGIIGSQTLGVLNSADPKRLIEVINDYRLNYVKGLSDWKYFGDGWTYRINKNYALADNLKSTVSSLPILVVIGYFLYRAVQNKGK